MKYYSDEELVHLYLTNERSAYLEQLYIRYHTTIYKKCLSFSKNPADAQDMAQDVFLRIMSKLGSFQGKSKFSTWLYVVTCNFCRNQLQSRKHQQQLFIDCNWEKMDVEADETTTEVAELEALHLEWSLQQLSSFEQTVLKMKYQDQISLSEIALVHGLTVSSVKMRLLRARNKIRTMERDHPFLAGQLPM